jgi:hypothetical protein
MAVAQTAAVFLQVGESFGKAEELLSVEDVASMGKVQPPTLRYWTMLTSKGRPCGQFALSCRPLPLQIFWSRLNHAPHLHSTAFAGVLGNHRSINNLGSILNPPDNGALQSGCSFSRRFSAMLGLGKRRLIPAVANYSGSRLHSLPGGSIFVLLTLSPSSPFSLCQSILSVASRWRNNGKQWLCWRSLYVSRK